MLGVEVFGATATIDMKSFVVVAQMLNGTDTVGRTFKRAFFRVDGVVMYFFWALWIGIMAKVLFDPVQPGIAVLAVFLVGMMNPILFVLLGVMRSPGLLTALIIVGLNVRGLWIFV